MSIKISGSSTGKYWSGRVEVDGVDISNRVQTVGVEMRGGAATLTLGLVLYGDDAVDLDVPKADVITARILRRDEHLEVSAEGDATSRYVQAAVAAQR